MLKRPLKSCNTKKFEIAIKWSSGPFWTLIDPLDFHEKTAFLMLKRLHMSSNTKKIEIAINWSLGLFWTLKGPFDFHDNIVFLVLKRPLMSSKKKTLGFPWINIYVNSGRLMRTEQEDGRTEEDDGSIHIKSRAIAQLSIILLVSSQFNKSWHCWSESLDEIKIRSTPVIHSEIKGLDLFCFNIRVSNILSECSRKKRMRNSYQCPSYHIAQQDFNLSARTHMYDKPV